MGQYLRMIARASAITISCLMMAACSGFMSGLKEGSSRNSDREMVAITSTSGAEQTVSNDQDPFMVTTPNTASPNAPRVEAESDFRMESIDVAIKSLMTQLDAQSEQIAALRQDLSSVASTSDFERATEIIRDNEAKMDQMAERITALEADLRKDAIIRDEIEKAPTGPFAADGSGGEGTPVFGIHVGSFGNEESLSGAWSDLQTSYPAILARKTAYFSQLDIEGVGAYQRLIAGPFTSQASASAACAPITQTGGYCRVTPLAGERLVN